MPNLLHKKVTWPSLLILQQIWVKKYIYIYYLFSVDENWVGLTLMNCSLSYFFVLSFHRCFFSLVFMKVADWLRDRSKKKQKFPPLLFVSYVFLWVPICVVELEIFESYEDSLIHNDVNGGDELGFVWWTWGDSSLRNCPSSFYSNTNGCSLHPN